MSDLKGTIISNNICLLDTYQKLLYPFIKLDFYINFTHFKLFNPMAYQKMIKL